MAGPLGPPQHRLSIAPTPPGTITPTAVPLRSKGDNTEGGAGPAKSRKTRTPGSGMGGSGPVAGLGLPGRHLYLDRYPDSPETRTLIHRSHKEVALCHHILEPEPQPQ